MNDIENSTEIIPKKFSFTSTTSGNRSRAVSFVDNIAVDLNGSITTVVPTVIEETIENDANNENDDDDMPLFSNRKVYKNLFIISSAFLLMYTAFNGILALQSSLNTKGNVGVNSLIIINALILFSAIFLTSIAIYIFGLKWTMAISDLAYIYYIVVNIHPIPSLMYTAAVAVGLASGPYWTAQATYTSCIARYHAHHKKKKVADVVSLFFGIFFVFFGSTGIWGNLISYFLLNQSNNPQIYNCGIYFDPLAHRNTDPSAHVSDLTRYVLCGVYGVMGILSMILLSFSLDQIRLAERQPVTESLKKSFEVIRSLSQWKHIDQLFLAPLTMWTMVENTFLTAQFTRAFITCLMGIRFIGLVLIANGICMAVGGYVFGGLAKYIGRLGCFIIAALLNYTAIILMYFWEPVQDQMYVLFIIAALWGLSSAAWQSQVVATYTVLYSATDSSAIMKYRLWKAVGSLITYSYASYITIELTLIVLLSFLTVSMISYGIVEIRFRWKNRPTKLDAVLN